ncbi:hypothetical protein PCANC_03742 [Puccinia coronata f. sp. avenae]|uniref:Prefoldin, alpha subunit n=1 Tax=Puccinia coronata f. sp. avenae TaxID=200324 RepID=A0A2N5SAA3_9BASI|nr:hypothetical protein PCANC_14933 [Puccinia coronata f. sp. avenae]PLW53922.1 hypothetical protein PCANC_03742 [Puccinia coronata f. sp. avenae]
MAQSAPAPLNVQDLDASQLASVKEQLDQELVHLTNSFAQLQGAIAKFNTGIESIDVIQKKQEPILVPLTSSLYVPGKLKDPSRIMLDVGTGYLIDQPIGSARSSLNRKVLGLGVSLDQLQSTIETKQEHLGLVRELIQIKTSSRPPQPDSKTS